jgi:hypothetical protein
LRARLEPIARARYGTQWVSKWARAAGWNPNTLHTFLYRGQRLPPADKVAALERALGVAPAGHDPACPFFEFAVMVAGYEYMRRAVLALTRDESERARAATILEEAQRMKKLEREPES